jgi:histone acetyltransferase (RNA polymerase elongator complex component)
MSKNYYIIPIFVPHQGCPHNCVFCNQTRITGVLDDVTAKDAKNIIENYLKTIDHTSSTVEVSFFGGTFTAIDEKKQKELLEVAKYYKQNGQIDKIRMSTRPDYIDDYILSYLRDYSVDIIELGVQSLDDEVLIAAGRGHSSEQVERASKLIKEFGFTLGHQIMPGLPKDNYQKDILTAQKSIAMQPDIVRLYPALVIKDTPMEEMLKRGIYKPYSLEEAVDICKELYMLYNKANIQVIRMGLQPTEAIREGGDIVEGPFHPSFRELVEGKLYIDKIKEGLGVAKDGIVKINPKDISKLYANKKIYFKKLLEQGYNIKVETLKDIQRGNIIVCNREGI